jgi:hypothetical protein
MKEIVQAIKRTLAADGFEAEKVIEQLKELREYFKANLDEPGYVRMIRLAYEDIENNGEYTYQYLEEGDSKANLEYFVDLLADCGNKYNREELQEIRQLMDPVEEE